MARFLVINRPLPDEYDLFDTATKICESYDNIGGRKCENEMEWLSKAYFNFMKQWAAEI
jgi:hypothetical protein